MLPHSGVAIYFLDDRFRDPLLERRDCHARLWRARNDKNKIATPPLREARNDSPSFCHCEERSDFVIFVIASLNAEAFRRGNLFFR
jgi:hypothetical protein